MKEQSNQRLSLVDGSIETVKHPTNGPKPDRLIPIFGTKMIKIQTLEGIEEVEQKYIIGFIEQERPSFV